MGKRTSLIVATRAALALLACGWLAGCASRDEGPPPRSTTTIEVPPQDSIIAVPVTADLGGLAATLEGEIPKTLARIDRPDETCVASRRVKVAFVKLKTPRIECDIVGTVTRGPLRLSGEGEDLVVTFPVHAEVQARDIAGVLKQETATADATASARMRISLDRNWNPRGKVDLAYHWTDEPHIEFLGQRIEFTQQADKKLRGIVGRLERKLPAELGKLELRAQIARLWSRAFTSLQLNRADPPVWMRVTPQQLQYGGYSVEGNRLRLNLGMKARTETFVGDRPADPDPIPLPDLQRLERETGHVVFFIPVIADYAQLEPVVRKALIRRQARPFPVPGVGPVAAQFGDVEIYGTTGGRIAAGVTFAARAGDRSYGKAQGRIWLTATPVNEPGSRRVTFRDLVVRGDTDNEGADLLLKLANSPGFSSTVAQALAQNFEQDYDELMAKITRAISDKREGDLVIRARIDDVRTGSLQAAGQGLYLPVWGRGTASIVLPSL